MTRATTNRRGKRIGHARRRATWPNSMCVFVRVRVRVCAVCVYIMCAYLSCPTAFVVAVMSEHTQTHTLTTYGVNKLQAMAQGLSCSEEREREKEGGS